MGRSRYLCCRDSNNDAKEITTTTFNFADRGSSGRCVQTPEALSLDFESGSAVAWV